MERLGGIRDGSKETYLSETPGIQIRLGCRLVLLGCVQRPPRVLKASKGLCRRSSLSCCPHHLDNWAAPSTQCHLHPHICALTLVSYLKYSSSTCPREVAPFLGNSHENFSTAFPLLKSVTQQTLNILAELHLTKHFTYTEVICPSNSALTF